MSSIKSLDPWSDYWATGGGSGGRCLPEGPSGIETVLRGVWTGAAHALDRGDRVLDLATGDGTVLARIRSVRQDLELIGIDGASRLPPAPPGVTLRAGIAMEQLPFPNSHFDLVTSQFGLEYGDTAAVAGEVRRVLAYDGCFLFIVHHRLSPIVAHNLQRAMALSWAARDSDYLREARALVVARTKVPALATPESLASGAAEARRLFPMQPVAWEFVTAILRTLEGGRHRLPEEALEVLAILETRSANELARIAQLEQAACSADQIHGICRELGDVGLNPAPPAALCEEGNTHPFAWLIRAV